MFGNVGNTTIPVSLPIGINNGGGFGNGNGFDDIIALAIIAMIFGWNGNGNGIFGGGRNGGSVADAYVLNSDFATIQRQLSDGFGSTESKLDSVNNGICSLGYDQLGQMNGINMNIMQGNNALAAQLADCCCKTQSGIERINTQNAMNTAAIQNQIQQCCCDEKMETMQTRYDMATQNCATLQAIDKLGDRIIDRMNAADMAAKDAKIAEQACLINNQYLLSQINRTPIPAYVVQNPYCQCNGGYPYGFGFNGTTVA